MSVLVRDDEERIFHTLVQRDQWFQILIGSKGRELGQLKPNEDGGESDADDPIPDAPDPGREEGRDARLASRFGHCHSDHKFAVGDLSRLSRSRFGISPAVCAGRSRVGSAGGVGRRSLVGVTE